MADDPLARRLPGFRPGQGVTILSQTPTAFSQLLKVLTPHEANRLPVRQVILGGESLRFSMLRRFFSFLGDRVKVFNIYGPTETTVWVTCHPVLPEDAERESESVLGHALQTITVKILDDAGHEVADGEMGEIVIGGPTVSAGYLGQPELTAQRFVRLPPSKGPRTAPVTSASSAATGTSSTRAAGTPR